MNKLSRIFRPVILNLKIPHESNISAKSHKLMLGLGLIRQGNGFCQLLPLAQRSLDKLTRFIDYHMGSIGAQKITLPLLTNKKLWEKAGTLETAANELLVIKDRTKNEFILSPTHEEAFTNLFTSELLSHKQCPLLLYQITPKFRDEPCPKHGLIRTKEFLMKDLYTFDTTLESAKETYNQVIDTYEKIFKALEIPFIKALAVTDESKILQSHEFHYENDIGEDKIARCPSCEYSVNTQVFSSGSVCPQCSSQLQIVPGIEVGHTFLFGTWYSKSLGAKYVTKTGNSEYLLMSSYGIGLSRLIAATTECLSTDKQLRWPLLIAPYTICIIPPKKGSKESDVGFVMLEQLYRCIEEIPNLRNDVVVDDRTNETIGRRLLECKFIGFPYIVVIGHSVMQDIPMYELHDLCNDQVLNLTDISLREYFTSIARNISFN